MGAIVAFALFEVLLFGTGLTQSIARALDGVNWMLVLGALMVVGWPASHAAHTARFFSTRCPKVNDASFADAGRERNTRRKTLFPAFPGGASTNIYPRDRL